MTSPLLIQRGGRSVHKFNSAWICELFFFIKKEREKTFLIGIWLEHGGGYLILIK